jgi:uncharacterized protein YecA (UPF0149 family)
MDLRQVAKTKPMDTDMEPEPTPAPEPAALCPCKSGQKFKRCCGKEAPPALNKAA